MEPTSTQIPIPVNEQTDIEFLEQQIVSLENQKAQALADANACAGGIQVAKLMIDRLKAKK